LERTPLQKVILSQAFIVRFPNQLYRRVCHPVLEIRMFVYVFLVVPAIIHSLLEIVFRVKNRLVRDFVSEMQDADSSLDNSSFFRLPANIFNVGSPISFPLYSI
jgi:hypothetical protein